MDTGEQAAEESSANRRERLLALRSAAAASSSSSPSAAPPVPSAAAAWDLPEPDLAPSSAQRPPARFGFYTNPGAAFSSAASPHKRKSPETLLGPSPGPAPPHAGSRNYGSNHPPHQHHMDPSLMEPAPPGTSPWRSPMQFQTPMSEYREAPPGPPPHWNPHSASPAQDYYPPSPNFGFRGSNIGRGGNPMNYGPRGGQMNYGPRGGQMNYGPRGGQMSYGPRDSQMNYGPRGGQMNYRPRDGPMNYGPRGSSMNYGPRGSPCSSSGRGRGENYYSSPSSRGRGGRGGSGYKNPSWEQVSMIDDPWKDLQPIVGSILIPIGGGGVKSWLPESLRKKKDTPDQGRVISTSGSGLSLAEYLDLSFNEVSNET